jgi:hypothetical protein
MAWDKVAGGFVTVKGRGSLYVAKLFEVTEGCVVSTPANGPITDFEIHEELLPGSAVVVTKWNDGGTEVEASKLYLACDPSQEAIWKRLFISMAAREITPDYGGMVSISKTDAPDGSTVVDVGSAGTLIVRASNSSSELPQEIIHIGPGYREVATVKDGSDSLWSDGDWKFKGDGFASAGTFVWDAPAMRPDAEDDEHCAEPEEASTLTW